MQLQYLQVSVQQTKVINSTGKYNGNDVVSAGTSQSLQIYQYRKQYSIKFSATSD